MSQTKKPTKKIFDWITQSHAVSLTPFQQFTLDVDWRASPLGPMQSWPPQLRHMVLLVFADPSPAVVYWGEEATIVYNEPYTHLIGDKHPSLQGQDPKIGFAEVWDHFERLLSTQRETGLTEMQDNAFLLFKRHGFLEETYFSWKFVPIVGDEGYVVGSHATVVEVTREFISDRRLLTISALNQEIALASTIKTLWTQIMRGLDHADKDIPLALLYSAVQSLEYSAPSSRPPGDEYLMPVAYALEGSLGVSSEHPFAPAVVDMRDKSWLAASFRNAMKSESPVLLQEADGTLPIKYMDGIEWRGYNVRPSKIIVCPIQSTHSDITLAFLVIALNPRRPYDDDYQSFIHTIMTQILVPQFTAILLREEVLRRETTAKQHAITQEKLSRELSMRILEVKDSEMKFASFAARVQIGLAIFDKIGSPLYGNKQWESLTQLTLNCTRDDWNTVIVPDDRERTHLMFDHVVRNGGPVIFQFRLTKPWKAPELDNLGNTQWTDTCVLCSLFEDLDENGDIKSVMTTLTDISDLKWVEAQLLRRTVDVEKRELMWRNFTARAPVGLCLVNPNGSIEFGNDTWWTMTETSVAGKSDLWGWRNSIFAEDVAKLEAIFTEALLHHVDATLEFRLNRFWEGSHLPDEVDEPVRTRTTILGTVHTIFNDDSTIRHLVGWFTDISAQKAAQTVLRRRMDEAIEMKQQQERFIDMTSHEMRNPLSAMLHCADEIIAILEKCRFAVTANHGKGFSSSVINNNVNLHHTNATSPFLDVLGEATSAAETIIYCALHQKRIVDDILTLSRLDSELLFISPEPVQPVRLLRNSLKMFEAEMKRADFRLDFVEEKSVQDLNVEWTLLDPSRVLQIFINLMTNAIKFTRTESKRQITVMIGASRTRPSDTTSEVRYVPKNKKSRDQTMSSEWREEEVIYLSISVKDTGRGLNEHEKNLLFNIFQQASPKTHVDYGGSGLGLFISRQLVEIQGGEIGMAAKAGQGSTFTFFVKTKQTLAPVKSRIEAESQALPWDYALGETYAGRISDLQDDARTASKVLSVKDLPSENTGELSTSLHVLVVEDNLVNQKVLCRQLQNNGCTVMVANHGEEALDFLRKSEFWVEAKDGEGESLSVILMDLEMPIMDGLTCVSKIREMQTEGWIKRHVPVIAVTANVRKDQIASAMEAGMDDVTTKPYRIPEVLKRMNNLVARNMHAGGIQMSWRRKRKEVEKGGGDDSEASKNMTFR